MKNKFFLFKSLTIILLSSLLCVGCSPLIAPSVTRNRPLSDYKYVYITPASEKTSITVGTFGNMYGIYGLTNSRSVNPEELICGHFLKRGYTRLPELKSEYLEQTIVVNYGESGRRNTGFGSYTIEVTIQLLSAQSSEVICVGTAEGRGETEADDVRIAINRCMDKIFEVY